MNRLIERDILGAFTILLVVFGHASLAFISLNLYGIHSNLLASINSIFGGFTMPLFLMIGGLLFQYSIEKGKYQASSIFLSKKIKRLLVPFLIVSPFMIYFFPVGNESLTEVLRLFLNGAHHLWFILTLLYAYLFFYYFKNLLDKSPIISLSIFIILSILGRYISIKYGGLFGLSNNLIYFLYFYLGIQLWKNYTSNLLNFNHWVVLALYLVIRIVHMLYFRFDEYVWANSIFPVFEGILGSLWAWRFSFIYGARIMHKMNRPIHFISRNSYGIYLFHLPIIYSLTEMFRNLDPINIYFVVLTQFTVSLFVSVILTEGLRKIKNLKMIIGE
jgi:surface polysaccharide O-acyltransferase-like enzyme